MDMQDRYMFCNLVLLLFLFHSYFQAKWDLSRIPTANIPGAETNLQDLCYQWVNHKMKTQSQDLKQSKAYERGKWKVTFSKSYWTGWEN